MTRTVLLWHRLPDGSAHYDWLIERENGEERVLTYRTDVRVDQQAQPFAARRLPDHRAAYLTYEGRVSNGRGSVQRLASGAVTLKTDGNLSLTVSWAPHAAPRCWILAHAIGSGEIGSDVTFTPGASSFEEV